MLTGISEEGGVGGCVGMVIVDEAPEGRLSLVHASLGMKLPEVSFVFWILPLPEGRGKCGGCEGVECR
jgi:hypothetical protein